MVSCRGFPISSLHVPECSFHVGVKWIPVNVSMAYVEGKIINLHQNREPSIMVANRYMCA